MALDPKTAPMCRQEPPQHEQWRPCSSYPGYSVSSCGRVRNDASASILSVTRFRGRPCVRPYRDGKRSLARIAALVAEAFCGLPSVSALKTTHRLVHKNGNPSDNRPANILVLSKRIRSDRDVLLAQALKEDGLTLRVIRRLTGVSAKVLRRRRPPPSR